MSYWETIYYSNKRGDKVVIEEILPYGIKASGEIFRTIDLLNQ